MFGWPLALLDEVSTAVKNVTEVIASKFFGKSVLEQAAEVGRMEVAGLRTED